MKKKNPRRKQIVYEIIQQFIEMKEIVCKTIKEITERERKYVEKEMQ